MVLPMIAIRLAQRLIAPHPSNCVFHHDPTLRKRLVIGDIFGWSVFAARFPARGCTQPFRMQFANAHVRQIANATHACEVEIDRATGALMLRRYLVAHDCGTEINPVIVAGQVHGAVAMGLSGALKEHAAYDADGQASLSLMARVFLPSMMTSPSSGSVAPVTR